MNCYAFAGSGATAGFDKLVHLLGVRKGGRFATGSSTPPTLQNTCTFPSCARSFGCTEDLQLHQRTHRDGDFHAVGSAVAAFTTPIVMPTADRASVAPADITKAPLVLIGPYAHHSNLLPW